MERILYRYEVQCVMPAALGAGTWRDTLSLVALSPRYAKKQALAIHPNAVWVAITNGGRAKRVREFVGLSGGI